MTESTIAGTVASYYAALSARDVEAVSGLFAPHAMAHLPVGAPPLEDAAALRAWYEGVLGLFIELSFEPHSVFPAGPAAAVKWSAEGRDDRGGKVSFEGIDVLEFDAEGHIEMLMGFWDPAAMIEELRT
ncbi:nuclear transport factor 2 family protein [Gemmatimonadota bacterium]